MNTRKLTLSLSLSLSLASIAAPVDTTQHYWYSPEFGPEFNTGYNPEPFSWSGNTGSGKDVSSPNPSTPAARSFSVMPYYAYVNYEHSAVKSSGNLVGAYGYYGVGSHAFDGEVDHFDLDRKTISNLSQWDLSAAYANYVIPHWRLRLAGHYIVSDDHATDDGWTLTPSVHYYAPSAKWDAGLELAYSKYAHYAPSLDVLQVAPGFGFVLLQTRDITLRDDAKAYWIHLGENIGTTRNLFSAEDTLSLFWRNWTFAGFGWGGKQTFAVRSEGFVVYNLNEEHKYGFGGEVRYNINSHFSVNARYSRERYRELGAGNESDMNIFLGGATLRF
jgi:hypothetical protein